MWLLPCFPRLARTAAFVYYRIRYGGEALPRAGPALLVANHPNSLLDPVLVVAARIAFGAAALTGSPIPVVPVGLVFRQKDVFRSAALALVGPPVPWDDLAARGAADEEAVRLLTARIADALQQLTVNLERWQDQPLVDCAMRIWEAERGAAPDPGERVARLGVTTRILAAVRRSADATGAALARDVDAHRRRLRRLGLRPGDLVADVGFARSGWWAVRRAPLVMPLAVLLAAAGLLCFWVPYQLTAAAVGRTHLETDVRATHKLLWGAVLYGAWLLAVATAGSLAWNAWVGLGLQLGLPAVGMAGLVIRERMRGAGSDVRRFLLLRSRRGLADALRAAQRDLGARLDALYQEYSSRLPG